MARADTITLIPLDRVAAHLQVDPWHFNGITSEYIRNAVNCPDLWFQYDYQASGKLSREGLAFALRQAEDVVMEHLHWSPIPIWNEEEVDIPYHYQNTRISYYNSRGNSKSVKASKGLVTEVGKKKSDFVGNAATAFSGAVVDAWPDDTVTVTVATDVTDGEELHLYYPGKAGREEWEIRPLTSITADGTTATFVFPKYLIPLEALIENIPAYAGDPILIDGNDNTNFLSTVDIYRVYSDPSEQITFYFEPTDDCTSTTPCTFDTETGCLYIRDARRGILAYRRADWDADEEEYVSKRFTSEPTKAIIYYRAGLRDLRQQYPNLRMDQTLERMITFYALSLLDTELCGCDNTRELWKYMTTDLAHMRRDESYNILWQDLANPMGTTRAALRLWKHIQYLNAAEMPVTR